MTDVSHQATRGAASHRWTALSVAGVVGFVAWFAQVGADCLWLVALGDHIRAYGVPEGVPYATADSAGWHNVLVLAQLVLSVVHAAGEWGLPALQVVAVLATLVVLALDARLRPSSDGAVAVVVALVAVAALPALVIVRLQVFSLPAFALLLLLLRAEHRRASHRIWLLPVLVAVWTNLHGAVLLGVAVAGCYLLFGRLRRRFAETVTVGVVTLLALLATPQGLQTAAYYWDALHNRAAVRGTGLWARIDLGSPLDLLLVVGALVLLVLALHRHDRIALWEWVALAGLLFTTTTAARHGVWLLLFLLALAAAGASRQPTPVPPSTPSTVATLGAPSLVLGMVLALVNGSSGAAEDQATADAIQVAVDNRVVLAPGPMAELLAEQGERVWVANPLDAFDREDQDAYLDFLDEGRIDTVLDRAPELGALVVEADTAQAAAASAAPGFRLAAEVDGWHVWVRDTP